MKIKKEYLGVEVTVSQGTNKRVIEIYEGMDKNDIKFLQKAGIPLIEEPKKRKAQKYEGVEEKKEEDNGEA